MQSKALSMALLSSSFGSFKKLKNKLLVSTMTYSTTVRQVATRATNCDFFSILKKTSKLSINNNGGEIDQL